MAPKKNDEQTVKKTPKKRVVKPKPEKPKLKTPTVIKLKIPLDPFGPNGITPKLTKKQLTVQKKLELANEVALSQLTTKSSIAEEIPLQVVLEPKVLGKGKRKSTGQAKDAPKQTKRKKNSTESVSEFVAESSSEEVPKTPKKKAKRKPKAKENDIVIKEEKIEPEPITSTRARPKRLRKKKYGESSIFEITDTNVGDTAAKIDNATKKLVITDKPKETNNRNVVRTYSRLEPTSTTLAEPLRKPFKNNLPNIVATRASRNKVIPNKFAVNNPKKTVPTTKEPADDKVRLVVPRKTSSNSSTSGLSWTQDVSTSSTTTCVTVSSNDFVRFDRKLPVVQITNLRPELEVSSSESESSSSSQSSPLEIEGVRRSLDLSVSSPTAGSAPQVAPAQREVESKVSRDEDNQSRVSPDDMDKILAALDCISSSLCDFDGEMVEWIGGERAAAAVPVAFYDALKLESEVIAQCRIFKRIVANEADRVEFARPAPRRARREEPRPAPEDRPCEDLADRARLPSFDASADDDDALSLFAESITAIDSSRIARHEEYVPTPVIAPALEPRRYRPTRIDTPARRSVCEKQSADSTSVRILVAPKPSVPDASAVGASADEGEKPRVTSLSLAHPAKREHDAAAPALVSTRVAELSLHVRPVAPKRSAIFRGLCFYNLATHCRLKTCRYAHMDLDGDEVRRRVAALDDEAFLCEYALVAAFPALRRRAALACVRECARRGLTRALLQGAAQLLAADAAHAQAALEVALQHLNQAEPPGELLELRAGSGTLCDALLRALADTQNFSRFRAAFVKLAAHCAGHLASRVPQAVVASLLERLCILPCDEDLARAMLKLVALADPRIYRDRMMPPFEVQLSNVGGGVYEEYLVGKERATRRAPPTPTPPAPPSPRTEERYTSPDTTHYDTRNNLPIEPMITRTVDFKRALTNTTLVKFDPRVPPPPHQTPKPFWRKGPFLGKPNGAVRSDNSGMKNNRPMMRPISPMNRRTIIKRQPNNYQRRLGGDFYD